MSRSDFEKLSIAERQQAALQSCVIDDASASALPSVEPEYSDYQIDYHRKWGETGAAHANNVLHQKNAHRNQKQNNGYYGSGQAEIPVYVAAVFGRVDGICGR